MPNIVFNRLAVSGPPDELRAFVAGVRDPDDDEEDPRVLDFRRHVPIPPDLELRGTVEPDDHAGLPPWYWWATENWGTKWNALGTEIEGDPTSGPCFNDVAGTVKTVCTVDPVVISVVVKRRGGT